MKNAVKITFLMAMAVWITCAVPPNIPGQQDPPNAKANIESYRPLSDLADELEGECLAVITYEEPLLVYRGDLDISGPDENAKWGLKPKKRFLSIDRDLLKPHKCDLPLIESIVDSFNAQNTPLRFQVLTIM